jgi:hypothetical protein
MMDASFVNVTLVIVGVLAACLGIARILVSNRPLQDIEKDDRNCNGTRELSDQPQPIPHGLGAFLRGEAIVPQPYHGDEQHRATEEVYWRESLRKQGALNIITLLAAVAGLGGLVVLKQTLDTTQTAAQAAKTQAEIGQKQLELSERSWVGVAGNIVLTVPLRFHLAGC